MKNIDQEFHDYLRTQFSDLLGARRFMWRWVNEMSQEIPGFGGISSRALAAHCSAALEGIPVPTAWNGLTDYQATTHGPTLYHAAWGDWPEDEVLKSSEVPQAEPPAPA